MSPGVLLFINLLTIPFVVEAEIIGCRSGRFPKLSELIRLKHARHSRWFKGYLILLAIWLTLILVPTASGTKHEVGMVAILTVGVIQTIVWIYVIYRIKTSKKVTVHPAGTVTREGVAAHP